MYCFYLFRDKGALLAQQTGDNTFVCSVPGDYSLMAPANHSVRDFEESESDWRCLAIVGQMAFSITGVAAEITARLAESDISVLVMSGYKTDYFFVKSEGLALAIEALTSVGHEVIT